MMRHMVSYMEVMVIKKSIFTHPSRPNSFWSVLE